MNNLNLQEIDQEQALNISKFFIRSQQNLFLFGKKGLGKTHIAMQAAKACNVKINYINLSVIERPDLAGFPNINNTEDVITFKSPIFLPPLQEGKKPDSIILFDEVDKAPQEVTSPLLEILQFKKINGKSINALSCILTGNLANEGAYSNIISTALLDRGAKYILSFNFDKWIEWAKSNDVHDLILGFLKYNPDLACGAIDDLRYASPSPRSWTLASEALIKAKSLKIVDLETITQIISGFVGYDAGIKFKNWYDYYRKFEPIVYTLIDSERLTINYHELAPTEQIVFVITACYCAKQKTFAESARSKDRFKYLENLCKFLKNYKVDYEIQVIGLYNAFDFDTITKNKLYMCKEFFDLFTKISEHVTIKSK